MIGPFCAFLSSVTWAFGSTGYSKLARNYSALTINLVRALSAFPLFFIVALATGGLSGFRALDQRHIVLLVLSMVSSYAVGDALFLVSARVIGIPAALTISSIYPLITSAWGAFFQGEWLSLSQTLGLLLSVFGVIAVILSAPVHTLEGTIGKTKMNKLQGVLLALGCSFCWAINSYTVTQGGEGISPAVGNTIRMGVGFVLCLVFLRTFQPRSKILISFQDYKKFWWIFVMESFGGSYLFLYGLSHSKLAIGSTLSSLAPVISVPIAVYLGLEKFSLGRTTAVLTVVVGLWLLVGGLST